MVKIRKKTTWPRSLLLAFTTALVLPPLRPAQAAQMCRLPDGFAFRLARTLAEKGTDTGGKGIGGTGIGNKTPRSLVATGKGIGGTGISFEGGVGVYGRITGFGSICVNGLEVHYSSKTPVEIFGTATNAAQLQIGQVVSVIAQPSPQGLEAESISATGILSGPVTRIDTQENTISVAGKTVAVTHAAALARAFKTGERVVVSGFRTADGGIAASFVAKAPAGYKAPALATAAHFKGVKYVVVQGYARVGAEGRIEIGQTSVKDAQDAQPDARMIVLGRVEKDGLHARFIHVEQGAVETELPAFTRNRHEPHGTERLEKHEGRAGAVKENAATPENERNQDAPQNSPRPDSGPETSHGIGHIPEEHSIERPGVALPETPAGKTPETPAPEIQAPNVHAPEVQAPSVQPPDVQAPQVSTPQVQMPDVPHVETPAGDD